MPANTNHTILASTDPTPPPYTTVLPNGVSVKPAILNACTPNGMPMMVTHSTSPITAQLAARNRPPKISHKIFGNYIHALLTGQRILPACLVVLLNLLKLGVGKADNRFWRPCSLDTVAGGTFSCGQKQPAQNQPLNMPNIANKSRTRTISTGNVPYFTAHLFEFPKNVFNV
jgi:hypothetical protein